MLHGRPVTYAHAGAGPVLLLVHGMGGGYENWREVIEPLARRHTVVAPDLPGHGASPPGNGDYSIGALAAGLRDLLLALGHKRATLVGHSLGGGIAMQFAYHFPEITERLALVSSGGLGPEVSPVLRAHARLRFASGDAKAAAPLRGVEPSRLVLCDESLEHRDEAPRRLELRQVADAFEDLEPTAGNRLMRVLAVVEGDDRIARAPDDQDGHALGEVEPVAGVNELAAGSYD